MPERAWAQVKIVLQPLQMLASPCVCHASFRKYMPPRPCVGIEQQPADSRELMSCSEEGEPLPIELDGECNREHDKPGYKCYFVARCCCWMFLVCLSVYSLTYVVSQATSTKGVTGFHGKLPPEPSFLKHLGSFCFGHRRGERIKAGGITVQLLKDTEAPWSGQGELYILLFDDEPQHWIEASHRWSVPQWREAMQCASACYDLLFMRTWNMGSKSIQHAETTFNFKILEGHKHQWHVAILGIDLDFNSSLQGRVGYRVSSDQAMAGWEGNDTVPGLPFTKCPPEPLEWMMDTFDDAKQFMTGQASLKEMAEQSSEDQTESTPTRSLADSIDPRVHCSVRYRSYMDQLSNAST